MPNVTVYLDRGFSVEANDRGEFELSPVPSGVHFIRLGLDNVPLPWGLQDERARSVEVKVRGKSRLDFPLINLNGQTPG